MMRFAGFLSACLLVSAVGCGGSDGGSYGDPIDDASAEAAGTQSVEGALDMTTLAAEPANEGAVGQAFMVYNSVAQMASIKASHEQPYSAGLGGDTLGAWDEGCVSVSGNTATYTACDSGGATIDGTITGSSGSVQMDLTITTTQATIDMTGDLSFSLTSLTGYIRYDTSVDAGGQTVTTTYNADYDVELLDGCAVGGQVEVHYTVGGGAGIDVWAKAEFGPNCGDVTFY
jgi:hypothetical protein